MGWMDEHQHGMLVGAGGERTLAASASNMRPYSFRFSANREILERNGKSSCYWRAGRGVTKAKAVREEARRPHQLHLRMCQALASSEHLAFLSDALGKLGFIDTLL